MKKWFGIVFIVLLSFQLLKNPLTFISWKINQEQITAEHCINKNRPELKCAGKCYLSKILNKNEDRDYLNKTKNNNHKLELLKKIDYFLSIGFEYNTISLINCNSTNYTIHFSLNSTKEGYLLLQFRPPIIGIKTQLV